MCRWAPLTEQQVRFTRQTSHSIIIIKFERDVVIKNAPFTYELSISCADIMRRNAEK